MTNDDKKKRKFSEYTDTEIATIMAEVKELMSDLCWEVIDREILQKTDALTPAMLSTLLVLLVEKMCMDYSVMFRYKHDVNINRSLLSCVRESLDQHMKEYMTGTENRNEKDWGDLR